jgi:sugar-specific transcriptional regulator TrmB
MTDAGLVGALEALGFNLNEARAYAALLARGTSTGYEVSQFAAIPRSAVYGVLRKLVAEGAARRTPGPPERFTAAPVEAVLAQHERRFESNARSIRQAAAALDVAASAPDAFTVEGTARALEEAASLVRSAETRVVVSGWPRELAELASDLEAAVARGVDVVVFSHAALPDDVPGVRFSSGYDEHELETFWKHRLLLVADDRRSVLASTEGTAGDRAVVSHTTAIAEVAVLQVALDITLLAQRQGRDVSPILARILGDRVGRLDTITPRRAAIEVGRSVSRSKRAKRG